MVESDQILLAELVALKAKGTSLTYSQEQDWERLLQQYPESKTIIRTLFDEREVVTPFDIRTISIDEELEVFKTNIGNYKVKASEVKRVSTWRSIAATIAAFLLLSFIWIWYQANNKPDYIIEDAVYGQKNDVLPGIQYAELSIDNQNTIQLNASYENTEKESGFAVLHDLLIYKAKTDRSANRKHLLAVPKRSTYQVVLSDGTKVWVNPDSKLEYLEYFSKNERRVKLHGEAYFNVAKDASRPFIVETGGMAIQAVGTEFNVKSYHNKPVVQLTEGKIKVRGKGQQVEINAGNQVLLGDLSLQTASLANNEEATSWKDGFFYFNNKEIVEIIEELSRWYGIEAIYRCELKKKRYLGSIDKNATLAQVCSVLYDLTDYSYKIEQDKLIIDKK
ncbi:FecR family protein [Sphingobacterium athyrii]|uniref:Anti-sigma factor n=1 Tax=Sphingobacterium athyrii TaxID=2152717 RepID=A0A363NUQ8_9SPHI|nr:FecR family protein [Sphingobacterium athyrii]PUV24524.1 hypothetical protein DCO56_14375 [Sphingobacterium athyrii]